MARFIKIFTIMTGLSLMTACGASGLLDDLKSVLDQAQAALTAEIKRDLLDERLIKERLAEATEGQNLSATELADIEKMITDDVAKLTLKEIEAELDLPEDELADINAEAERSAKFKTAVTGLNEEQIETRLRTCRGTPNAEGCAAVLTNFCYDTPFDRACDATTHATRRVEYIAECGVGTNVECIDHAGVACRGDSSITGCGAFTTRVCDADPTYTACDGNADYFVAQDNACWIQGRDGGIRTTRCQQIFETNRVPATAERACRANFVEPTGANRFNSRCYNVVIAVCDLNPFDVLCEENTNYTNTREPRIIACRNEVPNALFCDHATTFACDTNPFDAICSLEYTTNDYMSERQTAVNDCQTTFVAGLRCAGAAEEFCTGKTATDVTDLFSSLCVEHSATDAVRKPLCVGDRVPNTPISARCTETATRICDARPLDPLCDGVDGYFDAQLSACVLDSTNPSCVVGSPTQFAALESIAGCLAAPFDAACLDIDTPQGEFFAPRAEAAQKAYCESGGARAESTTVATRADRVNCTNIGSSPVFADLARNITQNGITTYSPDGNTVTANGVTVANPNIGGFLRAGVFGTKLGAYAGKTSGTFHDETNNGNFDRGDHLGGAWTGSPAGFFPDILRIWEGARRDNPAEKDTADPNDGFTYFLVENDDLNLLAYAGIWQTTNFGAPLAAPVGSAPTSAIWAGNFTAYAGSPKLTAKPTNFYVDFANGTFNVHNPAGTDNANPNGTAPKTGSVISEGFFGGVNEFDDYVSSNFIYTVNGIFGTDKNDPNVSHTNGGVARTLNPGELSGNVTLVNNTFPSKLASEGNNPDSTKTLEMPLTGLIGVEGAVGVFLNPALTNSANVGGFTATAPTPTN